MKKTRVLNLISLFSNTLIVFFTCVAVYYCFRTDVVRDPLWFGYTGWGSLVFFTTLSNIFVAIAALCVLVFNIKNVLNDTLKFPKAITLLKYIATVAITVTLMTVILFLAPLYVANGHSYFWLFSGNNIYMHLLTPLLAIGSFLFTEYSPELNKKHTILGLTPVVLYSIVYFLNVIAFKTWQDFYGFTFGGKYYLIPVVTIVMYGATYLFAFLLYFIQRKIQKKK